MKQADVIVPFSFQNTNIRGKILRLDNVSKELLARFKTHKSIDKVFLDSLSLSALISSNFKFDGVFKLQIDCYDAPLKVILCDNRLDGSMRAFLSTKEEYLDKYQQEEEISFKDIVGKGHMIFHINSKIGKPYQAIIPLQEGDVSQNANLWYQTSEQIPTFIKILSSNEEGITGAIFLQTIAKEGQSEEERLQTQNDFNTLKILSETLSLNEMLNDNLEEILYKLYNEFTLELFEAKELFYKCSCSEEKIKEVLNTISQEEREQIKKKNGGDIEVDCSFCGKRYIF